MEVFKWDHPAHSAPAHLLPVCSHYGHILALSVVSRGDDIIVGDLMKSVCLLNYNDETETISELARDYHPGWTTAVESLSDDVIIAGENSYNLYTLRKRTDGMTDDEKRRLEPVGCFHLGEFINKFRPGMCNVYEFELLIIF